MTLFEVQKILDAQCITGEEGLSLDVHTACGSDMMSDVLAFVKDRALLLTGLVNQQVIRTAEMMDIHAICFVRGKVPDEAMVQLAHSKSMVLLSTTKTLYVACGELYSAGLAGGKRV